MTHDPVSSYDLVWGAVPIAQALNVTPRRAFYLLENGLVPGKKVGNRWVVKRSELDAFFRTDNAAA